MPVITVEGATMNVEQKRKLAEVLTREAAEIMKAPETAFIMRFSVLTTERRKQKTTR